MSDDAIRNAAADALVNYRAGWCGDHRECLIGMGDAVIDAVRPLIEAALREQLAAEIEDCGLPMGSSADEALAAAARIVREAS